uniref:Cytochrome P450 n=1 Tax=Mycena chlorophos TaxID=658473 RepID=A0ABQ0KVZ9_MYCCL|nr:cytochrome P450 [Mycena chlorophos]
MFFHLLALAPAEIKFLDSNKALWGPDADEFRPERWLGSESPCDPSKTGGALGPHATLASFFTGPMVCPGYRLAIFELQVVLVELLSIFSFALPSGPTEAVRPALAITIVPKTSEGTQRLPLIIQGLQ